MTEYKILCDIDERPNFIIGGQGNPVNFDDIEKVENLNRIYCIQFHKAPQNGQLEKVVNAIKKRPEITLRFYGDYSEDLIDWEELKDIQKLQIDLWETENLDSVRKLINLKRIGISKNVKSKVSLSILEPLQNLEVLFTSISKDIESIANLNNLKFLSLREIKTENLNFLISLEYLKTLWISLGSFSDFNGLSEIKDLEKLWIHQVRGFRNETANSVLNNCRKLTALKLDNLKHLKNLDFVAEMPKLNYLSFEGVKNLESYSPISKSQTLKTIAGYQCKPADKSLNGLKNLKEVWLGDSYSKPEIESLLNESKAENIWIRGKLLKGDGKVYNPFDINEK